jgi:hydrogenase-4 component B
MTLTDLGLLGQPLLAVLAFAAAVAVTDQRRSAVAGTLNAALGLAIALTGIGALLGQPGTLTLGSPIPGIGLLSLAPDRLGGIFLIVVGLVGALSAWFGVGYAHGASATRARGRHTQSSCGAWRSCRARADAVTFLLGWELMALGSTVLLLSEHAARGSTVRSAVLWYAAMTHLSFVLLLAGFAVLVGHADGASWTAIDRRATADRSERFAGVRPCWPVGSRRRPGLVPVHVWLPRAHPEAPSHVSAPMSAAMVKLGVYGLLLLCTRLLPDGPHWWGIGLLLLGGASAVYGILQASVTSDLKRLLAYSTTENLGLMVTGLAVAMLLRSAGQRAVADVALVAVILLVVSHAAFKTVLFLGAGSILHATGERDLDRLGGLARLMPRTATATSIAALAAAALPISSGFVARVGAAAVARPRRHPRAGRRPGHRHRAADHGVVGGADGRACPADLRQGGRDRLPRSRPVGVGRGGPREPRNHDGAPARRRGASSSRWVRCRAGWRVGRHTPWVPPVWSRWASAGSPFRQ